MVAFYTKSQQDLTYQPEEAPPKHPACCGGALDTIHFRETIPVVREPEPPQPPRFLGTHLDRGTEAFALSPQLTELLVAGAVSVVPSGKTKDKIIIYL